jgi:hypothetical protein
MVCIRILARGNINNLTKKIFYWRMPIGIRVVGVLKKPLSITY